MDCTAGPAARPPAGGGWDAVDVVPGAARERAGVDPVRLLEAMPAGFCVLDGGWRLRYVNAYAERLIGRSRAELLGAPLWEALPALPCSALVDRSAAALASGEPAVLEWLRPAAHGPGTWHEVRMWHGPGGIALQLLDVSDRRSAEDAARQAAARTALLARVITELSGAVDTESALGRLARLVVPTLADGCIVTVVDRGGRARDVGSWHADPARRVLMAEYTGVRLDARPAGSPGARALDAGTPGTQARAASAAGT